MKFCCRRSIKASHLQAILSYGLCCRSDMKKAKAAVESALVDNQRALLIRAIKMNAAPHRLFVDFLFVDNRVQIDSMSKSNERINCARRGYDGQNSMIAITI